MGHRKIPLGDFDYGSHSSGVVADSPMANNFCDLRPELKDFFVPKESLKFNEDSSI